MNATDETAARTILVCEPGWELPLMAEVQQERPAWTTRMHAPGWVEAKTAPGAPLDDETLSLALSSQLLPAAATVEAESVNVWGRTTSQRIIAALSEQAGPWHLHVFRGLAPAAKAGGRAAHARELATAASQPHEVPSGRLRLIRQAILDQLKQKQRRLLRTLVDDDSLSWQADESLVQVALQSSHHGFLSVCLPSRRVLWRRAISRFAGGVVAVPEDRQAPSRAFQKIAETEIRLARPIAAGEHCVDLGSSPGGWAYWALNRGARVVAVDRSPLREDLMRHPALTFVRGDAFDYFPVEPVDWLLCDVIAFPERINQLLADWLGRRLCRHFCVTVKFRGQEEYTRIAAIKQTLAASGARWQLRRLTCNKNEITAFGSLPDSAGV